MIRTDYFRLILIIVLALTFGSMALAQTPGAEIDARDAAQSAAIDALAARQSAMDDALAERAEIDGIIGGEVIGIKTDIQDIRSRLKALEDAGAPGIPEEPEPPVEPEPPAAPKVKAYLIGPDGALGAEITGALTLGGPFNICALAADVKKGPVRFSRGAAEVKAESQPAYCLFGGNAAPFPVEAWPGGAYALTVAAPELDPLTVTVTINGPTGPPPGEDPDPPSPPPPAGDPGAVHPAAGGLQAGPWFAAPYNIEDPYINILHASALRWTGGGLTTQELIDGGYIDPETGLPVRLPGTLTTDVYFTVPSGDPALSALRDGDWIAEGETEGGGHDCDLSILYAPAALRRADGPCRLIFTRDYAGGRTPSHHAFQVTRLGVKMTALRVYRAEDEPLVRAGKIFSPRFLAALKGYAIARTMDLQNANAAMIRSADELAGPKAAFWSNSNWRNRNATSLPYYGTPLAAVFALGVESGAAVWTHSPISLGAPESFDALRPAGYDSNKTADNDAWAGGYRRVARENAAAILDSPEWDRYADAYVKALIDSGYPADRPVYSTLANEVWNFAILYYATSHYSWGLGEGLKDQYGWNSPTARHGYGAAMARWKLAVDAALKRAGRTQNIVYVIEGQAANPSTTAQALNAARDFLAAKGEAWEKHAPGFAWSVATYWGARPQHLERDGVDPNDLAALENWFLNGPADSISTLPWNLKYWRAHAAEAAKFSVAVVGPYEGGSHFEKPAAMTKENYVAFLWGEPGARVNAAVNDAFLAEFPGASLSNYGLCGPIGGQPWFEGPCGADNPYAKSWDAFKNLEGAWQ